MRHLPLCTCLDRLRVRELSNLKIPDTIQFGANLLFTDEPFSPIHVILRGSLAVYSISVVIWPLFVFTQMTQCQETTHVAVSYRPPF